jgi:O-antigen polysaccharide polymerase Wzy
VSETAIARPAVTPPSLGALARILSIPMVGITVFVATMALVPADRTMLVGCSVATGTLVALVIGVDRARPRERRNLLLTIFSFSYTVFFVVPVFVFYIGEIGYIQDVGPSPSPIPITPEDIALGSLAALLGYVTLLIGYVIPVGKIASQIVPRMRREWSAEATLGVAMITIPMGWSVIFASQFGLIPRELGNGVLGIIASGTSFGIGLIAICYQRYRSPAALLLLALAIPPTMFVNFFTSSKMLFVMPLVMIVIVHVIITRRLRVWWIVGFLLVMALFYPAAQFYRDLLYSTGDRRFYLQMILKPQQVFGLLAQFTASFNFADYFWLGLDATFRRLDGMGILSVIIRDTPGRVEFQGGWSIAHVAIAYIPRVLWPGKPILGTGQFITETYGYGPGIESATGSTWIGELYMNFGWSGVLVGMTLAGVFLRFLQESFLGIEATIPAMLVGVVALLTLSATMGGDILTSVNTVVFAIAPVVLAHVLIRTLTPRPARMPPPL